MCWKPGKILLIWKIGYNKNGFEKNKSRIFSYLLMKLEKIKNMLFAEKENEKKKFFLTEGTGGNTQTSLFYIIYNIC